MYCPVLHFGRCRRLESADSSLVPMWSVCSGLVGVSGMVIFDRSFWREVLLHGS